ncbi:ABC transporter permease subunit [Azospirillum rugosum]|uniref:Polar amino acid transport system permease protein n=1 Tax=Azospirillum rugosum TaxID=416170 RepID=A0ABS4SWU7_9PROT|nr:ABC transporter permease subunit [Azospirillum rugosum]MBP2297015.1 polar amino acid transport system permease protein [Azospirillum rugosum]MDQ0530647.1 polar amino acid transport system permease protein [Azospirillum rugosum]
MEPLETARALVAWTPFLAGGFVWNIVISLTAMAIGTALGSVLAVMRTAARPVLVRASLALTAFTRNVPTFVVLFYLAFVIPVEFEIDNIVYPFPAWVKASIALAIAVVGFVSDNLSTAIRAWRGGNRGAALLFIPGWTSYFVIIVMASSTASVIGVGEIVSRCNTVIGATGRNGLMLWVYLYAMTWFFLFCFPLNLLMARARRRLQTRIASPVKATDVAAAKATDTD